MNICQIKLNLAMNIPSLNRTIDTIDTVLTCDTVSNILHVLDSCVSQLNFESWKRVEPFLGA